VRWRVRAVAGWSCGSRRRAAGRSVGCVCSAGRSWSRRRTRGDPCALVPPAAGGC
jgi:hypothetical protein